MTKKEKFTDKIKSKIEEFKSTPVKKVVDEKLEKFKNTTVEKVVDEKVEKMENTLVEKVIDEKLEAFANTKVEVVVDENGMELKERHNESILQSEGKKSNTTDEKKLSDFDPKEQQQVIGSIIKFRNDINSNILSVRSLRQRIDYIMKVINLSGLQNEIAPDTKSHNPIEHAMAHLIIAKGGLGESLKYLIPSPTVIAFDCYHDYLKVCEELEEKPTYEGNYPFIGDEKYVNDLVNRVHEFLKKPTSLEENHENWKKDREADGWVYGEVKDAEKKTHPSLVHYSELKNDEARKGKVLKGERFISCINKYLNPYTYPKQDTNDVEPYSDPSIVKNLDIVLPEGRYQNKGVDLTLASELNRVQLIDFIKGLMGELINDYIKYYHTSFRTTRFNLYNKFEDSRINTVDLMSINLAGVYQDLVGAKNLFGYTFQYFK